MEDTKLILKKLDSIKEELDFIKKRISENDTLTEDDWDSIREAKIDLKTGKTKRLI